MLHPCPCCGYLTLPELRGSFTICEVCRWEDDDVQFADPDFEGGANDPSLNQARVNYDRIGVSDPAKAGRGRPPRPSEVPPGQTGSSGTRARGPMSPPQT